MECLMIIDVQNGFVSNNTKDVLPNIRKLMEKFDNKLIIASQFFNIPGGPFDTIMDWHRLVAEPETDLIPFVAEKASLVIQKNIYSCCTSQVKELLSNEGIDTVYIAGIDTDCCVLKTAIDLFEMAIRPIVVADCSASNGGNESHKAALKVLERNIGCHNIITIDKIQ